MSVLNTGYKEVGWEMITITYLYMSSGVSALIRELHHSCNHSQCEANCKSKKEPTQSLGLQRTPSVPTFVKAAGLPPLVAQIVEIT